MQWGDHFALRDQLGLRAEEIQRRDLIIGQLTQANAALAARVPELETPQTSEDGTQEPVEDAGRAKNGPGRVLRPLRTPLSASRGGAEFSGRGGDGLGGARSHLVRLED